MAHQTRHHEWLGNVLSFISGALIGFTLIGTAVAIATGLFYMIYFEPTLDLFVKNFLAHLQYWIQIYNYETLSALILCGVAGLLGFNLYRLTNNYKNFYPFYIITSCFIFNFKTIVFLITIPYKFSNDPARVRYELFIFNFYLLIVGTVSLILSIILIKFLFSRYQDAIRRLCA